MKESLRHREAFELYYSMGEGRSLVGLLEKMKLLRNQNSAEWVSSITTLKRWSKAFNWQERLLQRDIENAKLLERKTNKTIIDEKANYRRVIKDAMAIFVENLKNGNVQVNAVQDAERLVKLDLLIMGEDTERGSVKITESIDLSALTDEELEQLEKIVDKTVPAPDSQ